MIIKTSPEEIQNFLVDASNLKGFCEAVYFPETTEDVQKILREADKSKTPVTVSGNGTGLAGARVPEGGIVISTEKLNKIIEISEDNLYAIVQPGVLLSDFLNETRKRKLLYPPDPTEKNCFIGGTVATNASGEKTFKYGSTRNYVHHLEIVLPNGELLEINRERYIAEKNHLFIVTNSRRIIELYLPQIKMPRIKNASGYFIKENMDAIDLFIGSEGTLGVITKIKLKLLPLPEKIISCIIFFNSEEDALSFIREARNISSNTRAENKQNSIDALALEFFDENSLKFLKEDFSRIPSESKAAVWFEQEADETNESQLLDEWIKLISKHNGNEESAWFAFTENDKQNIQQFRHSISAKVNEVIAKNNVRKLGTDAAVPDDAFKEFYDYSKNITAASGIRFVVYGHFGNSHMHLNMLPESSDEYEKGKDVYRMICRKAIQLNGTVSAEHGIGKLKREYLLEMYGEKIISEMKAIKKIFDPKFILGRGNMFV